MKAHWTILVAFAALGLCSCGEQAGVSSPALDTMPLIPEVPKNHGHCHPATDLSKIPNLETTRQLPPLQIPVTAKVVSRTKPVTCSDQKEPFEGALAYVTDGDKNGNEGFSVIIGEGPQWVQVDLGESHLIDAVVLWHYFYGNRVVNDVIVQTSEDPEFKSEVTTLFNNDTDNSSGQGFGTDKSFLGTHTGRQIPGNGTKARYIRTWSNGNTHHKMNEFIEVEVWGRPVK